MRLVILSLVTLLAGCTAMLLGGGNRPVDVDRSVSSVAADDRITATVRERLGTDEELAGQPIGVVSYRGSVTLTGSVASSGARDRAAELARGVAGVSGVDNRIVVRSDD